MFLIDPEDLTVYKLPDSALTSYFKGPLAISFDAFEAAAQTSYSTLVKVAAQGSRLSSFNPFTIEYVHLKDADGGAAGYAWATSVCVNHDSEYPFCDAPFLGRDFLLLWPYAMAIHTWLYYKERERFGHMDVVSRMVANHPPSVLLKRKLGDVPHDGAVAPRDLTHHQRYFVASLRPNLPHFALRQPNDDWSECLRKRWERRDGAAAQGDADDAASADAAAVPRAGASAPLDLPAERVERVLSLRIAEDLASVASAVATVASLSRVSRQFRHCTRDVTARMFARVRPLCLELHGPNPPLPSRVQDVLWASGLTLRSVFATDLCDWRSYVRERRKLSLREFARCCETGDGAKRHALLWS